MKWYAPCIKKFDKCYWILVMMAIGILSLSILWGCGKLNNDVDRPTSPIGTTGGIPVPIGPQSSVGTYKLSVYATPNTVPADKVTYATIHAKLTDSSGRSVENFVVKFTVELGYLNNAPKIDTTKTTVTGTTNEWGTVSVYYYGARAGSEILQASVTLPGGDSTNGDLVVTTLITVTKGPGVPGSEVPGVHLVLDPANGEQGIDCKSESSYEFTTTITAYVWDDLGTPVPGVRVELSGDVDPASGHWAETSDTGIATWKPMSATVAVPGWTFSFTGTVIIDGKTYTDTAFWMLSVWCKPTS